MTVAEVEALTLIRAVHHRLADTGLDRPRVSDGTEQRDALAVERGMDLLQHRLGGVLVGEPPGQGTNRVRLVAPPDGLHPTAGPLLDDGRHHDRADDECGEVADIVAARHRERPVGRDEIPVHDGGRRDRGDEGGDQAADGRDHDDDAEVDEEAGGGGDRTVVEGTHRGVVGDQQGKRPEGRDAEDQPDHHPATAQSRPEPDRVPLGRRPTRRFLRGDHVDVEVLGLAEQVVDHRPADQLRPARPPARPDDESAWRAAQRRTPPARSATSIPATSW